MPGVSAFAFATTAPVEEEDESYNENYDGKNDENCGGDVFLEFSSESFEESF